MAIPQTFDEAFARIRELVTTFKENEAFYTGPAYQEAEARKHFIDKFWIALGWDINSEKKQLASAQTERDKTFYESKCATLDRQIDNLVYELYDLTPEEIAIVDDSLEHRLAMVPELANRVLRVIVSKDEPKRVISVYLDRTMKGKL